LKSLSAIEFWHALQVVRRLLELNVRPGWLDVGLRV
jgi:hypothetical protein